MTTLSLPLFSLPLCIYIRLVSHQGKRNPETLHASVSLQRVLFLPSARISVEKRGRERKIFGIIFLRFSIVLPGGKERGGKRTKLNSFSRNSRLAQNGTIFSLRFTFIRRNGRELDDTEFSMGRERKGGSAHSRETLSLFLAVEIALTAAPGVERWGERVNYTTFIPTRDN